MGIETANQSPLGQISPANLIGRPDTNIVTPSATDALSDAFRKGFITADDVISRVDQNAQKKKELTLAATNQQIDELKNPDFAEARRLQLKEHLATSKANIAKAEGALDVIPFQLEAEKANAQLQTFASGTFTVGPKMLEAFTQAGFPVPVQSDGKTPDVEAMKAQIPEVQNYLAHKLQAATIAAHTKPQEFKDTHGRTILSQFNSVLNKTITPKEQMELATRALWTPDQWRQQGKPTNAMQMFGAQPGEANTALAPEAASPSMSPDEIMQARADYASRGMDTTASGMTDSRVQELKASEATAKGDLGNPDQIISPRRAAPMNKPTIEVAPASAPLPPASAIGQPSSEVPGTIISDRPEHAPMSVKEVQDLVHGSEAYKQWDLAKGYFNSFYKNAEAVSKISDEDQRSGKVNMNVKDVALAESFIKLYDPSGVIRPFKWEKVEQAGSIPERIRNVVATVMNTGGNFTPEVRKEIIDEGILAFKGRESAIADKFQQAKEIADAQGYPINHILSPQERRVLDENSGNVSGRLNPLSSPSPAAPAAGKGTRIPVNLPGRGAGSYDPGTGLFYPTAAGK